MTPEAVKTFLEQIKPMFVPNGTLELASLENNEIKLSVSGLAQDIFKVQGTIINSADETKNKIIKQVEKNFPGSKVTFI